MGVPFVLQLLLGVASEFPVGMGAGIFEVRVLLTPCPPSSLFRSMAVHVGWILMAQKVVALYDMHVLRKQLPHVHILWTQGWCLPPPDVDLVRRVTLLRTIFIF